MRVLTFVLMVFCLFSLTNPVWSQPPLGMGDDKAPPAIKSYTSIVTTDGATYITNVNDTGKVWVKATPKGVSGVEFPFYKYKNGNAAATEVPFSGTKAYKVTNATTLEVDWFIFADTLNANGMTLNKGNWGASDTITELYDASTGGINPNFAGPNTIYWLEFFVEVYEIDLELIECP